MRRITVLALLTVALSPAAAQPQAGRACRPAGRVLFEIDQRVDRKAKLATSTTRLFENGAWKTVVFDREGTRARTMTGCLEPVDMGSIRARLHDATWRKVRDDEATCQSDSPRFTVYRSRGRAVYTERACSRERLDAESQRALDLITFDLRPPELDGARVPRECMNPLAPGC
jgi:hypothetical protein